MLFVCGSAVHDLSVVFLLSTHDNLLSGTMTATIVMMSAASVQKKALTVSLLYPDFPFLVCPNFFLGCLAKTWELRQIFPRQAAFHFFSFSSSLARSDIILRLPPEVTSMLSQPNTSTASNALTPGPLITSKPSSEMSLRSLKMHLHLVALMPLSTNWTLSVFSTTSPPS